VGRSPWRRRPSRDYHSAPLIDEYHLFVYPVALGGGKPFFADQTRVNLELLETRTFSNRVVYLRYRRA
jgi:dihydrofolate reductase